MPDYGHPLRFGAFLTPQAARPQDPVALAQLCERAGLDLVTFQDHPYQPAFVDTWTLLSWVAARTERVEVAPNVMNLPLRLPSVIGRAVASLDRLSGGRVALGLGAGAFWEAIEAMGGRRLTPGQAVEALSEAIDVIRAIWDTSTRRGVNVEGRYYRVKGAKRGPEPTHEIPIWIGAHKPRMLRLTGAKGDGWLPSLQYMELDDVPDASARIDEAAEEAGRSPREVRRLLNITGAFSRASAGFLQGPPEQWVEDLLPLVLEHGFSCFILGSDDARLLERFAREVAPGLREEVERERRAATGSRNPPPRWPS
jgi:alkanesulfonate monooxygenase SsuD/methylene tetrahydromethanopterin reductase-like flavin-dependent oxidoreductase (luciferase family)